MRDPPLVFRRGRMRPGLSGLLPMAVMSEVDTGSLVLAAYKQPMTLTFAPHTG